MTSRTSNWGLISALLLLANEVLASAVPQSAQVPGNLSSPIAVSGSDSVAWPWGFISNEGQWESQIRFAARLGGLDCAVDENGITLVHHALRADGSRLGSVVRLQFAATTTEVADYQSHQAEPIGSALPGQLHFFLSQDPRLWRKNVPRYPGVCLRDLAPEVAASLFIERTRLGLRLEGKSAQSLLGLGVEIVGAEAVEMATDGTGAVAITTRVGSISLRPSRPSSDAAAAQLCLQRVEGSTLRFDGGSSTNVSAVDLQLEWSTYLGGVLGGEHINALAVDNQDRPVVGGETLALDFPATPGAFDTLWAGGSGTFPTDAFVTCLTADGSDLVYSTFLGGSPNESVTGIAVLSTGDIAVAGAAGAEFPTTPGAWDPEADSLKEFVLRLSADGSSLVFSTMLGGTDSSTAITCLLAFPNDRIGVAGWTQALTFPITAGAFDPTLGGSRDGFLTIFAEDGTIPLYSTYLGGNGSSEGVKDLALRFDGTVALTGSTNSADFPVTHGAFAKTMVGSSDGFVLVLDPSYSDAVYCTYIPQSSCERIAACPDGSVLVAGNASSSTVEPFPTTPGAFQEAYQGGLDACLFRLDATGSSCLYATFLGSAGFLAADSLLDLTADSAGQAVVVGMTYGVFPTTPGSFMPNKPPSVQGAATDLFVAKLDVDGSRLLYSTHLGGTGEDGFDAGVALDSTGAAIIGTTGDWGWPTTAGSFDPNEAGIFDATVSKLSLLPTGVLKLGSSTPGESGPLTIGVTAMPALGATDFGLSCLDAPARSTTGFLLLSLGALQSPLSVKGCALWVDPAMLVLVLPQRANADGYSELPLVIPNDPRLLDLSTYWQYLWKPEGGGVPWSASNALEITFQP
ncbi:MAG: DUF7948 domain-containing protein [Planctomycetota bacterium]